VGTPQGADVGSDAGLVSFTWPGPRGPCLKSACPASRLAGDLFGGVAGDGGAAPVASRSLGAGALTAAGVGRGALPASGAGRGALAAVGAGCGAFPAVGAPAVGDGSLVSFCGPGSTRGPVLRTAGAPLCAPGWRAPNPTGVGRQGPSRAPSAKATEAGPNDRRRGSAPPAPRPSTPVGRGGMARVGIGGSTAGSAEAVTRLRPAATGRTGATAGAGELATEMASGLLGRRRSSGRGMTGRAPPAPTGRVVTAPGIVPGSAG
jgi:hypothetical protein